MNRPDDAEPRPPIISALGARVLVGALLIVAGFVVWAATDSNYQTCAQHRGASHCSHSPWPFITAGLGLLILIGTWARHRPDR